MSEETNVVPPEEPDAESTSESPGTVDTIHYSVKQAARARDVLTRMYAVRRSAKFYPIDHPAVIDGVDALAEAIRSYHDEGVELQFTFFEGEILLGDQLLTEESLLFDQLIRDMTSIGVGSLVFRRGVEESELARATAILAADAADVERAGGIGRMATEAVIPHVYIGAVSSLERMSRPQGEPSEEARSAFGDAVSLIHEIDRLLRTNRTVTPGRVKAASRSLVDNVLANRQAMLQMTGLKDYDDYTFYHSANVAILSLALASTITSDYRLLSSIGVGALLHDIGKLTVGYDILNKPGALDPDEWAKMREHPVAGAEMAALIPGIDKSAIVMILEHHMRWDGTGYPARTPRRKQHLASRIVAVADAYDAMTSKRSYSAARVQDEAIMLLVEGADTSLDPVLVRLFVQMMGVYPPRSVVRLSTGEVAVVLTPTEGDPLRPTVRIIAAPGGEIIEPTDMGLADVPEITIEACLDPRLLNIEVDDYV